MLTTNYFHDLLSTNMLAKTNVRQMKNRRMHLRYMHGELVNEILDVQFKPLECLEVRHEEPVYSPEYMGNICHDHSMWRSYLQASLKVGEKYNKYFR